MTGQKCVKCSSKNLIKKGLRKKVQRYKCKDCGLNFQNRYLYKHYQEKDDYKLKLLNAENVGIRSMARITGYSTGTIIRRILHMASLVTKPLYYESNQVYEMDELRTFVGKNNPSFYTYIMYAINRKTKKVMDVVVGARTSENLGKVVLTLKALSPKKVITDKLNSYPNLVKPTKHDTTRYSNNRIERCNLTLRTHVKRISRKTICFSKSIKMLRACILLYMDFKYWSFA